MKKLEHSELIFYFEIKIETIQKGEDMGGSTIKEVAKMAGVSVGTVSRYINGFSVKEKNKKIKYIYCSK